MKEMSNFKKMKKVFSLFGILLILSTSFGFAAQYSSETDSQNFDSVQTVWSSVLENEHGERLTLSFLKFNWDGKSVITAYLSDQDSEYEYLSDSVAIKTDTTYERHLWGCLDGASFSQKFKEFFRILVGGEPYSISPEEEQEFEKEGRVIENTPGTGAYKYKNCYETCLREYEDKLKGDCSISSTCPRSLSTEDAKAAMNCKNECVTKFNCGTSVTCNTFAPDGYCGIKRMNLAFMSKGKEKAFALELNIEPETGKLIDGLIMEIDPSKGFSMSTEGTEGGIISKQELQVVKETGNIYDGRGILGISSVYKFGFLYGKPSLPPEELLVPTEKAM